MVRVWWELSSWLQNADFSLCPHMMESRAEEASSIVTLIRAIIPFKRWSSLTPNHIMSKIIRDDLVRRSGKDSLRSYN